MVGGGHQLLEAVQRGGERARALDRPQGERGHRLQGHRRDHSERPQPHPGHGEDVGVPGGVAGEDVASHRHELERPHLGGQAAEAGARAVCPGGQRTRDGLPVDVAQVGQ
jgi:hypothetical protein